MEARAVSPARRWSRRLLPVVVSAAALAFLLRRIDPAGLLDSLSWRVAAVMLPALLVYGAVTLVLEAVSVLRLLQPVPPGFGAWTAARIKCASYLLAIVNYALGAAALTLLLRRRGGTTLGEAASVVLLISSTDLVLVLALAAAGTALLPEDVPVVSTGLLTLTGLGFFGGLALIRAPGSLGPLERIRSLAVFDALRRLPLERLCELLALRSVFSLCFLGVCASAFYAFEIHPPFGLLVAGIMLVAVVGALPIAVAGLGTTQMAVVVIFGSVAPEETLLAMSLVLSAGMIGLRTLMGFVFAREFTREALAETRSVPE
jgi:uncharacterized membrane protein YbhN (UPF0104 family)